MNRNLKVDEWKIIEEGFNPALNRASESIFSIGNGHMGQRANFEEHYSGDSLRGSYIAGIYYPDRTRVGWWKNGYPEYFAKVLNSPAWTGIDIKINGEVLDLARCSVKQFRRELDMKRGVLSRSFTATMNNSTVVSVEAERFVSMDDHETAAIRYCISLSGSDGEIEVTTSIDANVKNEDANYGEYFWEEISRSASNGISAMVTRTRKTAFEVAFAMTSSCSINDGDQVKGTREESIEGYVSRSCTAYLKKGEKLTVTKFVSVLSSQNHKKEELENKSIDRTADIALTGYNEMLRAHEAAWDRIWSESDVVIEGDRSAQQGIRFNIFQLFQTYTGDDPRLNIGPKGFTGEKYGGSTYWDTEAFGLPFYLNTAPQEVARNLLLYRYKHLPKAIENASKLGFNSGAALFPMVTMNGEECHNEWEITFEEIHRNGAIAFAIKRYIDHTGDEQYLAHYGLEVLIAISRFWSQRVNYSPEKGRFVILGVTGPNEYENNVNNNWYTNMMAGWTLSYTIESIDRVRELSPEDHQRVVTKTGLSDHEGTRWKEVIDGMYYPVDEEKGIFLQQDGYLDKEPVTTADLKPEERPINQHWSWDRILRSPFIKQADVLQGIYSFEEEFDRETIRRNFDFYEPRTVHESSLSPSVYSIVASLLGYVDRAYELYLRTARLDLDDYNKEVREGLHITSMAGTWLAIVEGFGGMRIRKGRIHLNPVIPDAWNSFSFMMRFRNSLIKVKTSNSTLSVTNMSEKEVPLSVAGKEYGVEPGKTINIELK